MTTRSRPGTASDSWNERPRSGTVPSTSKKLGEILAPTRPSGSPNPVSVDVVWTNAAIPAHAVRHDACQEMKDRGFTPRIGTRSAISGTTCRTTASRSGSWYGNGESSTECTRENTTVVAPMPNAKVRSVVRVKSGWAASARQAWRTSRHRSSSAGPARKRVTVGSTRCHHHRARARQDRVLRLLKVAWPARASPGSRRARAPRPRPSRRRSGGRRRRCPGAAAPLPRRSPPHAPARRRAAAADGGRRRASQAWRNPATRSSASKSDFHPSRCAARARRPAAVIR